ncbi:FG-GAP-like repeat-containing protein [Sphaerisporangium sp. NPDC051011]|uniref:FG-GAP-like repeat-containing protein n=1 Tax=Sphaerisporangium sp. NPDC051011 TaxID=3155792 RepID=UPI0033D5D865
MNTRRSTGRVALVLSIVLAVFVGLISPVAAADDRGLSENLVLTLNASDIGVNPADLRNIVPAMQADIRDHGGLGNAVKQTLADSHVSTNVNTSEWPNFQGTVDVTSGGAGLAITVPRGQITTAGFWSGVAASLIGYAAGYGLRVLCIAGLTSTGVGAATIPLVCTPLQGAVTGIVTAIVNHGFAGDLGSKESIRDIIIGGLVGLTIGALWEKYFSPWAKTHVARAFKDVGTWIRSRVPWVDSWLGTSAAEGADHLGQQLEELEGLLDEAMRDWGGLRTQVRVMPLGDSITYGMGDPDGNGYRDHLAASLQRRLVYVDFVGSQTSGTMADRENNGYPGWTIDQIAGPAGRDVPVMRPDVVTLMAGTNDMIHNVDPGNAINRLQRLIDGVLAANPAGFVVVATLTPCTDPAVQARMNSYNAQVRQQVGARVSKGDRIVLVEMSGVSTQGWPDFVHPNDASYQQMAAIFSNGVADGIKRGLLPGVTVAGADETQTWGNGPVAGPISGDGTQPGSGGGLATINTADYTLNDVARWLGTGGVHALGAAPAASVRFFDFDGDGDDDYGILGPAGELYVWRNDGGDTYGGKGFANLGKVALGGLTDPANVRFLDFNGDGKDDYGILGPNGELTVWRNDGGDVPGGHGWTNLGQVAKGGLSTRGNIRFMDADGDGDDDYVILGPNGEMDLWRNDGGDVPGGHGWTNMGRDAKGAGPRDAIRFMDLDGDGDDDYIVLGTQGALIAWRNNGGDRAGGHGWENLGLIAVGTGDGSKVQFMHADRDGDDDYVTLEPANGEMRLWINRVLDGGAAGAETGGTGQIAGGGGASGTGLALIDTTKYTLNDISRWQGTGIHAQGAASAASVRLMDFDGDGADDYAVLGSAGQLDVWLNNGGDSNGGSGWKSLGRVAPGTGDGSKVRFLDFNGDGKDDYAVLGPKGELDVWLNDGGDIPGGHGWKGLGRVAAGTGDGSKVVFLDFDKDGKADYGVLGSNGELDVWLNDGGDISGGHGWKGLGRVAAGTGAPSSSVRFMDIDGDGDDDYIVLGTQGAMLAWRNNGGDRAGGGGWESLGLVAAGTGDGNKVRFMDADKDGDEDYVTLEPTNGQMRLWVNRIAH